MHAPEPELVAAMDGFWRRERIAAETRPTSPEDQIGAAFSQAVTKWAQIASPLEQYETALGAEIYGRLPP